MKRSVWLAVLGVLLGVAGVVPAAAEGPMHTVSGRVFLDANRNGVWDAGEGPVDADASPVVTAGPYRAEAAADGTYQLRLPAGTHRMRVSVVSRRRLESTTAPCVVLSVDSDCGEVNFGFAASEPEARKPGLPMLPKVRTPLKKMPTPREPGLVRP